MSKTSQENKAKKAKPESVEVQDKELEQKAVTEETKTEETAAEVSETPAEESHKVKIAKVRGKKYQTSKKMVDVNKYYPLKEAIDLVKKTSFSKFDGKVEAHVTTFDIGNVGEITFPHLETVSKKIVILNDTILAEIKDGKVNFDILIATPSTMPKLLPFARVLGPKGLMPNPKNGTLTDKPEEAVKKLSVAKTIIKTEKNSPVIHMIVGKVSQSQKELEANIEELIKVVKDNKIRKLALCATMGPCVKVEVK
jgi:large subunit ribosomal protein L1